MEKEKLIFIVEDSEIIRKLICNTIQNIEGYHAIGFENGDDLLMAIKESNPSLIIIDYYLDADNKKHLTGEKIIAMTHNHYPSIPLIAITGTSQKQIHESLSNSPISLFIHKNEDDILDRIESAVLKFAK